MYVRIGRRKMSVTKRTTTTPSKSIHTACSQSIDTLTISIICKPVTTHNPHLCRNQNPTKTPTHTHDTRRISKCKPGLPHPTHPHHPSVHPPTHQRPSRLALPLPRGKRRRFFTRPKPRRKLPTPPHPHWR